MNVYIAKMTVPACPAYCSRSRLWPRPTHRQTDRQTGRRKWEQDESTRHSRSRHGAKRTDGGTRAVPQSVWTLPEMQLGHGGKLKFKKKEAEEKLIEEEEKKVPDLYMYQNLEAILLFFILNMVIVIKMEKKKKKKNNDKSVDLCY